MANIQLADNLRRLRKQYNYTQAQIGKKLHITHQAYSNRLSLSTAMQRIHHQLK